MCYLFRRIAISEYYHIPSTTTLLCGGCLSGPELHHYRTEHSRCSSERATAEGSGFPAGLPSLLAWLVGCSVYGENFSVESRPWGLCVAGPAKKRGGLESLWNSCHSKDTLFIDRSWCTQVSVDVTIRECPLPKGSPGSSPHLKREERVCLTGQIER